MLDQYQSLNTSIMRAWDQMYAYSKKYDADSIALLYPHFDTVSRSDIRYASDDNVKVDVSFVDLRNADGSIANLIVAVC